MRYLSREEVLAIHYEIIEKTGGSHGVRDIGLFDSILYKPKTSFGGKELYIGIFKKAAVYAEAFAQFHVFADGNKRTAMSSAARFLFLNGHELTATNKELESFAVEMVEKKLSTETIEKWFKKHSKKIK